jgi:two-component system nitrogen regulation response regulator GlnG
MKPVWIIDDDRSIRWVFEKALGRENIAFRTFSSAREAAAALEVESPQVLVSDIRMPGESGLELLQKAKALHAHLPVIIMTAYSDLDSAVTAFQGGAYEYLPKPFDVDQAVELIRRAIEESSRSEDAALEMGSAPEILGHAPAMQEVFRAIGRLSQSHAGRQALHCHQYGGDPQGIARIGTLWSRARRLHRRAEPAPGALRTGGRRYAVSR